MIFFSKLKWIKVKENNKNIWYTDGINGRFSIYKDSDYKTKKDYYIISFGLRSVLGKRIIYDFKPLTVSNNFRLSKKICRLIEKGQQ